MDMFGLGILCFLPILFLVIALFALWVWMLIDCLTNEPSEGNDKIVWFLVIFFLYPIGAILYFLIRRNQRINEHGR